jgi:hypothetical protein
MQGKPGVPKDELWQPEEHWAQLAAKPAWVVSALAHNHFPDFEQLACAGDGPWRLITGTETY